jgi:dimethyl sulfoxide reductase
VRVSWDTALDLVAKEMNRVYDNYGPSAVFGRSYGWMSTGKVNAAINL